MYHFTSIGENPFILYHVILFILMPSYTSHVDSCSGQNAWYALKSTKECSKGASCLSVLNTLAQNLCWDINLLWTFPDCEGDDTGKKTSWCWEELSLHLMSNPCGAPFVLKNLPKLPNVPNIFVAGPFPKLFHPQLEWCFPSEERWGLEQPAMIDAKISPHHIYIIS